MIRIIVLSLAVFLSPLFAHAEEDCAKAQEIYNRGKDVLNFNERKQLFLQAVELCPSYTEAHVNLGDAYENLGEFDAAEKHYQEALLQRPELILSHIGLGEVYLKTGRWGLAHDVFSKGLEINPEDERLMAGRKVATERFKREKQFYDSDQIVLCVASDEAFRLMCMCPGDQYSFLKRRICVPPILFASGSWEPSAKSRRQLDEIGKALASPDLAGKKWLIIGYADGIGIPQKNVEYSENRVNAVKRYLVDRHGIDPKVLSPQFFGQTRPRATNITDEGRRENRRVEIVLDE